MRLVAHAFLQALVLSLVEVVLEDWPVVGVRALLDDFASPLAWRHSSHVCQALFRFVSFQNRSYD